MIAKITRGSSVAGLARYLHGPGRHNEHSYGGRVGGAVIGGTLGSVGDRDGWAWAADAQEVIDGRPEVVRPVWHLSLRAAPGDRELSDAEWADIAQLVGERMGWAEQPWTVVRHGADHVHIVVSRVGWDGSLWAGRHDRYAAQTARQEVERLYRLQAAPVRRERSRSLTSGEHGRALRTGRTPERHELAARVVAAATAARGLGREIFEEVLAARGIAYRANVARSTGRVAGYSFADPAHRDTGGAVVWWKGSQLDRQLAWTALGATLDAPLPDPPAPDVAPKRLLERRATYEARVEAARAAALDADRAARRAAAPAAAVPDARATTAAALAWRAAHARSERTTLPAARAAYERAAGVPAAVVGGRPVTGADLEAIEAARLGALSQGRPATDATRTRPSTSSTSSTTRAARPLDRDREQGRGRAGGRGR